MELLYLSTCLNKLLVDWNLSIYKYFWMMQKLSVLQYCNGFCITVNLLFYCHSHWEIHLICQFYFWNLLCKMYSMDFPTSGLICLQLFSSKKCHQPCYWFGSSQQGIGTSFTCTCVHKTSSEMQIKALLTVSAIPARLNPR